MPPSADEAHASLLARSLQHVRGERCAGFQTEALPGGELYSRGVRGEGEMADILSVSLRSLRRYLPEAKRREPEKQKAQAC